MTRAIVAARARIADFVQLTKPGVVVMVLLTTAVGFYLGSAGEIEVLTVCHTLFGTAMAAAGALALNQFLERDLDALMERTRSRPLADGRLDPCAALGLGVLAAAAGPLYLALTVNLLAGVLTFAALVSYLFIYTPLKQQTPLCSAVGAVPGALPPLVGMAGAQGNLGLDAWVLFAILFLWQIPHSLAIARLYRDDYARAGMCFAPVLDRDGRKTGAQAITSSVALLVAGALPTAIGLAGLTYFLGAVALGLGFLACSIALARKRRPVDANRLLFASLIYLAALLTLMALDKGSM